MVGTLQSKARRAFLLSVFLLLPLVTAFVIAQTTQQMGYGDSDEYLQMAENPFRLTFSPHAYRILIPYAAVLVSALAHWPLDLSFFLISLLAFECINLGILFWAYGRMGHAPATAILLSLLYCFSYAGVYNLHNYVHIGFWWHLLVLLGFIAILYDKYAWLFAVVVVGALVNETIVILLPLFIAHDVYRRRSWGVLFRAALILVGFFSLFLLFRSGLILKASSGISSHTSFLTLDYLKYVYWYWGGPIQTAKQIAMSFLVLWPLAGLGFLHSDNESRLMALLIPLAALQVVIATDAIRMTVVSFPAVLLLVGNLFRVLTRPEQIAATVLSAANFYSFNWDWHRVLVTGCASFVVVVWYFVVVRRRIQARTTVGIAQS